MKVTRFNISKPRKYTKNGEENTAWDNVGTMTEFIRDDGSMSRKIEIPAISLDAQVFPMKNRETQSAPQQTASVGEEDFDGIPF